MEPIFTPLHLKNITPTTQPTFISPRKFTGRKKQPLDAVRKLDKKGFLRAFVTRGGVKVVKSEHQLQRMMSHWNEKLLSPTPHLSSQPTLTFRMSCVYRIVYKHPDEPFPFVWFCQKIIIKQLLQYNSCGKFVGCRENTYQCRLLNNVPLHHNKKWTFTGIPIWLRKKKECCCY